MEQMRKSRTSASQIFRQNANKIETFAFRKFVYQPLNILCGCSGVTQRIRQSSNAIMMKIRAAACVLLAFSSSIGYCIAQYQIRSMYSDDECFDLFAIRSYPVYYEGNGKDLGDDEDESTAAYNQCMEEVYGDDAVQSYYQNDNMNDNMNDNNKNNNNNNNNNKNNNNNLNGCRQIQNAKFAGAGALYESFDCAWTRSPLTNAPSVLISEYYGGCPADGNEPAVYTSVLQGCMPFYVLGSHQGNNNNNNNNNKKDKYFYRLECNEDGDVSTVRCSDSSCETCDIKTTYTQNKCYLLQDNFYATY
eukprot:g49381.t1